MTRYYKISPTGYPIISAEKVENDMIEYIIGEEPQQLLEAMAIQEAKEALQNKIAEANQYLKDTDWIEAYKLRHDLGLEIIPETSSKWEIINQREDYKTFLKGL